LQGPPLLDELDEPELDEVDEPDDVPPLDDDELELLLEPPLPEPPLPELQAPLELPASGWPASAPAPPLDDPDDAPDVEPELAPDDEPVPPSEEPDGEPTDSLPTHAAIAMLPTTAVAMPHFVMPAPFL
jgi:hypothetical protein